MIFDLKKLITLIAVLVAGKMALADSGRLDPHGQKSQALNIQEVDRNAGCKICHIISSGRLESKPATPEMCSNCHNQFPHSGIKEHQQHKSENITCLSCHEVHRTKGKLHPEGSGIFESLMASPLSTEVQVKHHPDAMLRKTCTDCHQWRKE
jgi:hypothetical protein